MPNRETFEFLTSIAYFAFKQWGGLKEMTGKREKKSGKLSFGNFRTFTLRGLFPEFFLKKQVVFGNMLHAQTAAVAA
ncbi:MAG: hypothetical protein ACOC4H_01875 [bacterium]